MKKQIKLLISACVFISLITACSDSFLDEKVLDAYAPATLDNKLGFEAASIGLYNHFSTWKTTTDDQTILGMFQLGTDIVWNPMGRSNGNARPYHNYPTLTATDPAAGKYWRYLYKLINNANVMISNADNSTATDMTQDDLAAYSAEAKFFRAWAYNQLVTFWGDVPLIKDPLSGPQTDFTRTPKSDVNTLIESDLTFAIANLSDVDAAKEARANQSMARQLLATVYLRINEPDKAEVQCTAIIESGKFSLVTERYGDMNFAGDAFSDMFREGKQRRSQGNTEVIWGLQVENPADVSGGSTGASQLRRIWNGGYYDAPGMVPCDSLGGRGIARLRLDNWVIYNLYDEGDMRNSEYTIHHNLYFNNPDPNYDNIRGMLIPYGEESTFTLVDGATFNITKLDTIYRLAPFTLKWGQFDPRDPFGWGMWKDIIMMRLGETYLLRAEARLMQDDPEGAADDINKLRVRAHAPSVSSTDMTLDFILDERVRELLAEENRRETLVRTGTLLERATRLGGTGFLADGNLEATTGIEEHNMLFPIPQSEIDLNKDAELEQNPGY
jgi:hypothetical protein